MEPTEVKVKAKMDPVAKLLGTSRTVSYRPEFAHITGMVTAGLLLSQFWYWSECPTTEKRDGWFYMTMDQISGQVGMIREEQETARKRLKAIGVLQEERRGNPGRMWFRLDEDRLYELLREYTETVKAGIPQCDNPAIKNAGIPQSKVRELRNLARGNATIKNAGIPQCILLENSSGESSIDVSGDGETPPINPPGEGQDAVQPNPELMRAFKSLLGEETLPDATATPEQEVWSRVCRQLESILPAHRYRMHFGGVHTITLKDLDDTTATLTGFKVLVDSAQGKFSDLLASAFREATGRDIELMWKGVGINE